MRYGLFLFLLFTTTSWADLNPLEFKPLSVKPVGYLRAAYFQTDAAADDGLVGARNGFRLMNARVGLLIQATEKLDIEISADGAALMASRVDPLEGRRAVDLRDAYLLYKPFAWAHLRVGQFKAPFNAETLMSDADLPFVTRSFITDGIAPPDAFNRPGLTLDRHVGAEWKSDVLRSGDFEFTWALAVVNGNGQNATFNDNSLVAPVGRLTFGLKDKFTFGVNAYLNNVEQGIRPNRLRLNQLSAGADLVAHFGEVHAMALFLWRRQSTLNTPLPNEEAMGAMVQLQWLSKASGMEVAVRATGYEPSSVDPFDRLLEAAAMVGYRAKAWPARFALQYS